MKSFEYKVVPAPRRSKRVKGANGPEEMFAHTLTDAINEQARQGWDYLGSETLPAEAPRGWLRAAVQEQVSVLVFRRERDELGPRLTAVAGGAAPEAREPFAESAPRPAASERTLSERVQTGGFFRREAPARREPVLREPGDHPATPLRASPRLGPADPS